MTDETDKEIVPYFRSNKTQITFEFFYILITFIVATTMMTLIHFKIGIFSIDHNSKILVYSFIGGFLGGWTLMSKWFYRTTARGKNNQHPNLWESHKFYWRILTPFVSALIAFSIFILVSTDSLPLSIQTKESAKVAFGFSFIFGYFSDIMMSKLSKWIESAMDK